METYFCLGFLYKLLLRKIKHSIIQHIASFRQHYLIPPLEKNLVEMTIPDKPNSRLQKYCLTLKGLRLIK